MLFSPIFFYLYQGNKTPASLSIDADISKILKNFNALNVTKQGTRFKSAVLAAFALKKSFISKLKHITNVSSVRIANLTRVRIAMTSPRQSKEKKF